MHHTPVHFSNSEKEVQKYFIKVAKAPMTRGEKSYSQYLQSPSQPGLSQSCCGTAKTPNHFFAVRNKQGQYVLFKNCVTRTVRRGKVTFKSR